MSVRGLILATFFLASLPVCFIRPFYGVLLWMIVAFLNPHQYTWSAANALPWALMVAVPTLAGLLIFHRNWNNLRIPKLYLLAALWAWFTITTIVSTNLPDFAHHAQDTWYQWRFVSKMLLMTAATVILVDSFARLRWLVLTVAGCFGLFVAKAFPFIVLTGGAHRLYGPEHSMIADNNDLGLALNMTLPLFFFLAQTESRPWLRCLFGALFFATIPAIFCTYSRGALVGLVVLLGLMFLQLRMQQRLVLIPVIAASLALALLFAPDSWKKRMDPTREDAVDSSAKARLQAWQFAWNLASDYPLTGGGFETFTPELFARYAPEKHNIHGPHSIYFEVLAEHGFPGLALYLALVFQCFLTAYRLAKRAYRNHDPLVGHYANMFRFSLVGFLTSGAFLGRAYFDYLFLILVCILVLERLAHLAWQEQAMEAVTFISDADEHEFLAQGA